jgi:sulfonate transport system permease protein
MADTTVTPTTSAAQAATPAGADAAAAPTGGPADPPTPPVTRSDQRRRRARRLGPGRRIPYARLLGPAVVVGVWSLLSALERLDTRIIPAPWSVVDAARELWTRGDLADDITTSGTRAFWGFTFGLVIGVALAVPAGLSRLGEGLVDGTAVVVRSIPSLGLIPLFILWLGIGESFKVAIIAISVFFPVYLNLYAALANIDSRYVELAETLGVTRRYFLRHVVGPGSLPGFLVGVRMAATGAWLSLVVLEQINATSGLGYRMFQAQNYGQTEIIFVGLAIYGILGFASDTLVRLLERRVLSWRRTLAS